MSILIDTNLLVYMFDDRDPLRQARASEVVMSLGEAALGRISAQCLSEFFSATTRGKYPILSMQDSANQIAYLARAFPTFPVTHLVVLEAVRGVRQHQFSFWDAQIWAVARLNQISTIFSEDFSSGAVLEGVHFENPLATGFTLKEWIT